MKILEKRMTPFLILAVLSASADINLYSAEITTVTIRNNRVKINLERAKKIVFEHSKIHSNNAKLTKLILEKENKKYVYAISGLASEVYVFIKIKDIDIMLMQIQEK
ncbi:hypothetical protein [uncultured Leptotrichia sp.]|uniref:hypothetical protein n=1 Tax=uncultured Leptotrichia sp. TaxID=159271 RepID=UPI002632B588|nr:hypothetical protein [uncultured Leptotrichia sp.]